ncbi:MAG TPA: SHD1 domain-containing protein [Thermoguttaceae bacterium]|nr:SHD1 domain-containing protein [Thermoguttaceae bacterium]
MWKTALALVTAVCVPGVLAADERTWTDGTGQHQVEAEYIAAQADKVWLRRASDDKVFELRLAELCQADQDHVQKLLREKEDEQEARRPDHAERIQYGLPRQLGTLANRAIDESSGLACSRRKPGLFWTHNDSGGEARVHLLDSKGRDLGSCLLSGVRAWDWEDMASFTWQGRHYLLLGDVGNNGLAAPVQILHLIEEPPIDPQHGVTVREVPVVQTIQYSYEDDHRNCEAVAVDPTDRTILLAAKHFECAIYALDWPNSDPETVFVARRIATSKVPLVTAMDVSPDGRRAVLATYWNAYEFERKENEDWAAAFSREPREIRMPLRIQGESICYGPDGRTIYLTSEKVPTPLWEVPVVEKPQ